MVDLNRSSISNNLNQELSIQALASIKKVNESIQPTYSANPKYTEIIKSGAISTTAVAVAYTTPRDKDFYLTFISIHIVKDATCDTSTINFQVNIGGATTTFHKLPITALTAEQKSEIVLLPYPIKCDRNTNIQVQGTFTAGTMTKTIMIGGFILE